VYYPTHIESLLISELKHRLPGTEVYFLIPRKMLFTLSARQIYPKALHEAGSPGFCGRSIDSVAQQIADAWKVKNAIGVLFVHQVTEFRVSMYAPVMYVTYP
jgi:hypothetical protein